MVLEFDGGRIKFLPYRESERELIVENFLHAVSWWLGVGYLRWVVRCPSQWVVQRQVIEVRNKDRDGGLSFFCEFLNLAKDPYAMLWVFMYRHFFGDVELGLVLSPNSKGFCHPFLPSCTCHCAFMKLAHCFGYRTHFVLHPRLASWYFFRCKSSGFDCYLSGFQLSSPPEQTLISCEWGSARPGATLWEMSCTNRWKRSRMAIVFVG